MKLGWFEIAIVLVIIVIIFGVGRMPRISEAIGRGLRSLRGRQDDGGGEGKETARSEVKVIRKLEDDKAPGEPIAGTGEVK